MSGHWRKAILIVLAMVWTCVAVPPVAAAQERTPFPCDDTYYLMQPAGGNSSALGRIAFPTPDGSTDTSFQPIATAPFRFNAIGYNHVDNLIYGVENRSTRIFRVGADGNFQTLGSPLLDGAPLVGDGILNGTFRANGEFVMRLGDQVYAVDVTVSPPRVVRHGTVSRTVRTSDFAVNPVDNAIYAYDRDSRGMVRIELDGDGVADVVPAGGALPADRSVEDQGTTWIDGNGRVTFLGGQESGGHTDFYQAAFDPTTRTYRPLVFIGTEPALAGSGDGANCAFRMAFEKNVDPRTVKAGQTVTYGYDITNGSPQPRTVTFTDDLRRPGAGGVFVPGSVGTPGGTVSLENGDRTLVIRGLTLAPGAHLRITASVATPSTFSGVLRNQARLTGNLPGGDVVSDYPGTPDPRDATPLTVTGLGVDIAVDKSAGGQAANLVRPGDTFDYTITATNNGTDPSWPVDLTDDVPAPLVPVAASDGGTISGQRVRWTFDKLAPGATLTRTITVRVNAVQAQTVVNTATAKSSSGVPDTNPGNDTSAEVTTSIEIPIPMANLRVTKTAPPTADPGAALTYTITVTNDGPDRAGNATVTDTLPPGYPVTDVTGGGVVSGGTVVWNLAPLAAGTSVTFEIHGVTPELGGPLDNAVTVTPSQDGPVDPSPGDNTARVTTSVRAPLADLTLTKDGPATAEAGARVPYTLTVHNNGPDRSPGSTVRDVVPAGFTLAATPEGATVDGRAVTWQLGELASGASRTLTYELIAPAEGGGGANDASVTPASGGPADPAPDNNAATVTTTVTARADLSITKSGPEFVDAGARFDWTIDVVNRGPSTARNVVVTDTVPAGFAVGTPTGPGTVTTQANPDGTTTVRWAAGIIAPNATVRFTVPVTAPNAVGDARNSAAVTSDTPDPDGAPPATNVVAVRGFTLTKTVRSGQDSVRPGAEVVYEIVAANTSSVPYDTTRGLATFRDDLAEVLDDASLVSTTPQDGITGADNGFTWTGPLAAGTSHTIVVTVRVKPGGSGDGRLRNTVVGGVNCPPGATATACSPAGSTVRELTLTKTASATVVDPGDELTYRVEITNTGAYSFTQADPAVVTDDLSAVLDDATFGTARTEPAAGTLTPPTTGASTLRWSGPLTAGATVTVVYTVTVADPQPGDGRLLNTVSSVDDPDCLPGNGCGPSEPTLVRSFLLTKTVDRAAGEPVAPGAEVTYSVVAVNNGQVDYDEATFADDLTGVLDDAELVAVAADVGTVSLGAGDMVLNWSGPLPVPDPTGTPGATITVTVRLHDPDTTGDHELRNVVSGSVNCPAGTAADHAECTAGEPLPVLGLTVNKSADTETVHAGGTVRYTVTVTNSGGADYPADDPAVAVDDMTGVLDDGEYAGDAAADSGAVTFDAGKLTWTGPLTVGATVTITYGVRVAGRGSGDHRLRNVVVADGSNCLPNASPVEEACGGREVRVAELAIDKTADVPRVRPGGRVTYTVTVHNTGAADYTDESPARWDDDLTEVLDDARYVGDAQASAGTVTYAAPMLSWSGSVAAGQEVVVRYTVEVPDQPDGDRTLLNTVTGPDSACPCTVRTTVDPAAPDPGLASTGTTVFWYVVIGLGLVAAGAGFFLLPVRRRRRKGSRQ